jgi:hypothetical protein
MLDYMLYGLSAGILVFLALFIISFITLASMTVVIHLAATVYQHLFIAQTPVYHYMPPRQPVRPLDRRPRPPRRPVASTIKVRRLSTLMAIKWPTGGGSSGEDASVHG